MVALCPTDTLTGIRDRALLLLAFASAMRGGELAVLRVEHLVEKPGGMVIVIPRSKTDQQGQGQHVAIPHGNALRPIGVPTCRMLAGSRLAGKSKEELTSITRAAWSYCSKRAASQVTGANALPVTRSSMFRWSI
jgi:integrase